MPADIEKFLENEDFLLLNCKFVHKREDSYFDKGDGKRIELNKVKEKDKTEKAHKKETDQNTSLMIEHILLCKLYLFVELFFIYVQLLIILEDNFELLRRADFKGLLQTRIQDIYA